MDIVHDPKRGLSFVPAGHKALPEDARTTYFYRVPTVSDRVEFKRALARVGARQHSEIDLLGALASGVRAILSDADDAERRDYLLALIAQHVAGIEAFYEQVRGGEFAGSEDDFLAAYLKAFAPVPEIRAVESVIADHWPQYADMCADRAAYVAKRGLVAARMFITGWEGLSDGGGEPVKFRRRPDGTVPDSLLSHVRTEHLAEFGGLIAGLIEPSPAKVKR